MHFKWIVDSLWFAWWFFWWFKLAWPDWLLADRHTKATRGRMFRLHSSALTKRAFRFNWLDGTSKFAGIVSVRVYKGAPLRARACTGKLRKPGPGRSAERDVKELFPTTSVSYCVTSAGLRIGTVNQKLGINWRIHPTQPKWSLEKQRQSFIHQVRQKWNRDRVLMVDNHRGDRTWLFGFPHSSVCILCTMPYSQDLGKPDNLQTDKTNNWRGCALWIFQKKF